jgi:hypothetical protein
VRTYFLRVAIGVGRAHDAHMNTTTATAPTTSRKPIREVWFQTDKNGRVAAYEFSRRQFRSFRNGLDEAKLLIATEQAVQTDGHPFPYLKSR